MQKRLITLPLSYSALPVLLVALSGCGTGDGSHQASDVAESQAHPLRAAVNGGVRYLDVTADVGVDYQRAPSPTIANREAVNSLDVITFFDIPFYPLKADGAPGVSILDYDADGDLDFFVTNGPGRAHSLYQNQLEESGTLAFVDVAAQAGVDAPEHDGTGTCFGDVDNDGDHDLLALGRAEPHRLFLNRGDGTFEDTGAASGLGSGGGGAAGCTMGDIDSDGRLDIAVAETTNWENFLAIVAVPFDLNIQNKLFLNEGNGTFSDVTVERGFDDLSPSGIPEGANTISWAISMVDYDQDGDVDILHGDDQAAVTSSTRGGVDRGYVHIFDNDGTGHFTNVTAERGTNVVGHWMGFSWADYDCDGGLDFFHTNVGDYMYRVLFEAMPIPYQLGEWPSAWFYSNDSGGFDFPPVGDQLVATPWGWGSTAADYDNDGDTDTIYQGGLHMGFINALDNPGVVFQNTGLCSSVFEWDRDAMTRSHTRRGIEGMASGDLNQDGYPDMISVAGFVVPDSHELAKFPLWGGVEFDEVAFKNELLRPINDLPFGPGKEFVFDGKVVSEGDLVVEVNSADNRNRWIAVTAKGSIGLTEDAKVNRDGIGAIVSVTPVGGKSAVRPIASGGPYASADALEKTFGLGSAPVARVDVLWPGLVRNRLYAVRAGSRVTIPEIPCSIDSAGPFDAYVDCVEGALGDLAGAGAISEKERARLLASAVVAWQEEH